MLDFIACFNCARSQKFPRFWCYFLLDSRTASNVYIIAILLHGEGARVRHGLWGMISFVWALRLCEVYRSPGLTSPKIKKWLWGRFLSPSNAKYTLRRVHSHV